MSGKNVIVITEKNMYDYVSMPDFIIEKYKKGIISKTHFSEIVAEAFRCSHLVVASATYNCGIFSNMETVLSELKSHGLKNRKIAIVENGSWAPMAGGLISKFFEEMKDMEIISRNQ